MCAVLRNPKANLRIIFDYGALFRPKIIFLVYTVRYEIDYDLTIIGGCYEKN